MFKKKDKIPVLCYHNIGTKEEIDKLSQERKKWFIERKSFDLQMKIFKILGYQTLTLDEFYNWKKGICKLPKKSILITFDDGRQNVYKYALPILKKYNLKATVFVIGNKVFNDSKNNNKIEEYMSKDIINICKKEYTNIEFSNHSYSLHEREKIESKNYIELIEDLKTFEKILGKTEYYAYPFGHYTNDMIKALHDYNYKLAFAFAESKKSKKSDDDYLIPRIDASNQKIWKFTLKIILPFMY